MADYAQNGVIGTLHNLRNKSTEQLEAELCDYSQESPMTLLLPCLFSELEGPAMGPIVSELKHATYLDEIIIGLDRANEEQFHAARRFFDVLPQRRGFGFVDLCINQSKWDATVHYPLREFDVELLRG